MKSILTLLFAVILLNLTWAQTDIYRAEAERINDLVHTKLNVQFDFEKEEMPAEAWVTLKPHFYPTKSVTLDAKGMLIHEVSLLNNGKKSPLKYDYDSKQLLINLGKTYQKDESYELYIQYTARPNEVKQEGSAAISDAKGLYFIDPRDEDPEKPTQIWTQGETESSSAWFPTIDKPNQKTTEEIYITVPDKFVTLSNGTLIKQTKNADGTRTDYWKQDQKHAPYLFYMGIGDFAVVKDSWQGKPVDYYVEHEYEPFAKEIFGMTPDMLTFFSERFGYEYPWDKYSQMVARDYVSGAMENTTAVIHMETAQQKHGQLIDENAWEDVIAHELAHHWFGDLVTAESWSNLTMNESFANYSEYLWREHRYGKASADAHRASDLEGYIMGGNFDKDLVRFHYAAREDMFDGVSYNKGGYVLHMLRGYLGDDAFFAGLNKYLKEHEYDKAEAHQLRLALEEVSGRDLNWFFNQWYYSHGHPKLTVIVENSNDVAKLNIKQMQEPLFEFPLTVDIYENGIPARHTVWVKKQRVNTFDFKTSGTVNLVFPNADHDLIAEISQDLTTVQNVLLYNAAEDEYTSRKLALENLSGEQLMNEEALNTLIKALDDSYHGVRIQAINALDITSPKVKSKAITKLVQLAEDDPKTLVRAAALNKLSDLQDAAYLTTFEKATTSESFAVRAAGLEGLLDLNREKAISYAHNVDDEVIAQSPELLAEMIPLWKSKNDTSHFEALTEMAAFYAFVALQDPTLAAPAEEAFQWIMATDSPHATKKVMSLQEQIYNQMKTQQPMALPYVKQMTLKALEIKKKAYQENASSSLKSQVEIIEQTLKGYN
ncbi:M1 family peptidase [Flavobacteriaceae bacterium Ap0902]|nr:M1 family peptidase [Flavobacteriaceae bacterium Ap0902]